MAKKKYMPMVKLTGKNKLRTAVFISGRGSNLKSLYSFSKKKKFSNRYSNCCNK